MSKIPTAREFYDAHYSDDAVVIMRDFAKLHVEAALEAASEKADTCEKAASRGHETVVDKDSILNAYPLDNIK